MEISLIGLMRETGLFMKSTALITAITFCMLVTSPAAMAFRTSDTNPVHVGDNNPEARLSSLLEQIVLKFDALEAAHEAGKATESIVTELDELQDQMIDLDRDVMANFDAMGQKLTDMKLPDTILKRHQDMVAHYQAHRARIVGQFEDKDISHWRWLLGHWWERMLTWLGIEIEDIVASPIQDVNPRQFKRSHQVFDPNNLPNKSMRPDKGNKPKRSKLDYQQASLLNSPAIQVADLGDFAYDALAGASDSTYLAETDEVILTQSIKDQALALNYDPVKIYHWVRNNIEWQPSWGAIQDAELTLDARRGNAMDIASLTIALLRASQIPARYVHGTIDVPIAQFNNWAGGFTSSDAAVDFAASGSIPTAAMISGGTIAEARIEHVWVEAAIDYFPSRGAINKAADAWVQLDPSYKQYEYLTGLDAVAISGINTEQLATDFLASGAINEAEGWISGFDPTILENAQVQAQIALEAHITNNMTNPTVGDVIGGRKTIIQEYPALPSSLPNRIVVEGARYDRLPTQLQQRVTYSLGKDALGQPVNPTTFAYAALNNEKVTLSFRPATPDDEAALLALLPEGEITDVSPLPSSIPSYLIEVIPELKVNGELKISGEPMALGQELVFNTTIDFPGRSKQDNYDYHVIAGSFLSVNVVAGNVSLNTINLQQVVNSNLSEELSNINSTKDFTSEEIFGGLAYSSMLAYFSLMISIGDALSAVSGSNHYLSAGYGVLGVVPRVDYLFGFPVGIKQGDLTFDIPISFVSSAKNGDIEKKKLNVFTYGVISSILEHSISERFSGEASPSVRSASAIKVLSEALINGQHLRHLKSDNVNIELNNISLDGNVKAEILQSVNAGLEVFTHTNPIDFNGNLISGYIVFDPLTSESAYKISGGHNGALTAMEYIFYTFTASQLYVSIAQTIIKMDYDTSAKYRSIVVSPVLLVANVVAVGVKAFTQCESKLIALSVVGITALMSVLLASAFSPLNIAAIGLASLNPFILTGLLVILSSAVNLMMNALIGLVC